MQITLNGEDALDRILRGFAIDAPRAAISTLNRTAQRAATRTRREVSAESGLQQKVLMRKIRAYPASAAKLKAAVWVGLANGIPFSKLPGAVSMLDGTVEARLTKGRRARAQAFKARMPSSGKVLQVTRRPGSKHSPGQYKRKGGPRADGQRTELPIEAPKLYLDARAAGAAARKHAEEQMTTYFPSEMRRLLNLSIARQRSRRNR